MAQNEEPLRIAVVGGGVAGIVAAYVLSRKHTVTLFEKEDYLGGHTNTRIVDSGLDGGVAVDTGFIVCNPTNYPNFYRLLSQLQVTLRDSDMCFGFHCENSDFSYTGPTLRHFLANPESLFKAGFLRMLLEQRRFNRHALADLRNGHLGNRTLGDYFLALGLSRFFVNHYIIPLAASIWSSPDQSILDFPAETFVRFFDNHGMLDMSRLPRWQTVCGGSQTYVRAFRRIYSGELRLSCPVRRVERSQEGVSVVVEGGGTEVYDRLILACHADQALPLLGDASDAERRALEAWRYNNNHTILHTDTSVLPRRRRLWASWNYLRRKDGGEQDSVSITYYMNRLQGLRTENHYLVSLNSARKIKPESVLYETYYTHPIYTPNALQAQETLRSLNGNNLTYYCGAHLRYGFHEDAVSSALDVAEKFGLSL